jgi:MFS family permease
LRAGGSGCFCFAVTPPSPDLSDAPPASTDRALARGLFVLTFINLFNYIDRYVVSAVVESLKRSELALSDAQLGSLMTGFIVVYMTASPLFGALGDRRPRAPLIALGVALWSLATVLGGLTRGFFSLFLARAAVGIGEAAYGTIAPSLLSDYFPRSRRGRVFAFFFAAIPIGSALGYVLGGLIDRAWGWRAAFFLAGGPGLLLALLALRLPDPPRGAQDEPAEPRSPAGKSLVATYRDLARNGPYALTVLGYAAYTFALGGMAFWMPAFLERVRSVPRAQATVQFGAVVVITGFVGTFAGGWLGDRLLKRNPQAYLWLSGIATLLAAPLSVVVFAAPSPALYLPALVVVEVLIFASTGPINSALVNLVAPRERASAVALSIFMIHVLGDVPSPWLIGKISDARGLGQAVLVVPVAVLLGGVLWCLAAMRGAREGKTA